MSKPFITRFAPSPSGHLHLGHAYSALLAYRAARKNGGRFLLRIEDIDSTRCKAEFEECIYKDLAWLGLDWEQPVRRQSDHFDDYRKAIEILDGLGVLYPCFCTRKDITREIKESGRAPHGPEGVLYSGTCREFSKAERDRRIETGTAYALRLDVAKALERVASPLTFHDKAKGQVSAEPKLLGDVVIARKDVMTSYHLSVIVDDHLQGITNIIRGEDLFHSTHVHRLLQALLGHSSSQYHHHGLLVGEDGKRFAKRDKSLTLKFLRESGTALEDVVNMMRRYGAKIRFDLPLRR